MTRREYVLDVIKRSRTPMRVVIALNLISLILQLVTTNYAQAFTALVCIVLLTAIELQHQTIGDAFAIIEHQEQVLARRAWPWN